MPGHKLKERNQHLWQTFSAKIPALWKEYQRLANTVAVGRIVINIRAKRPEEP